jgi:hypothetical protein
VPFAEQVTELTAADAVIVKTAILQREQGREIRERSGADFHQRRVYPGCKERRCLVACLGTVKRIRYLGRIRPRASVRRLAQGYKIRGCRQVPADEPNHTSSTAQIPHDMPQARLRLRLDRYIVILIVVENQRTLYELF